jgi:hypothetical protein
MKRFFNTAALCAAIAVLASFSVTACNASEKAAPKNAAAAPSDGSAGSLLSGKVVETMNSGGYTYVCLEKDGKKTWVAAPEMKVAVGQEMAFQPGGEMPNFTSKSLNRTFESIIFSAGPASPQGAGAMPAGHGAAGQMPTGSKAAAPAASKDVKVEKAPGKNGYTVGEIFEKRDKLDKKDVVVRGKVVKVSAGIMGSNWVHLQDGSGDLTKGTHDLVVTTQDLPKVGDVVTLKGSLSKDKDFGAGYKYAVIVEKGKIQR